MATNFSIQRSSVLLLLASTASCFHHNNFQQPWRHRGPIIVIHHPPRSNNLISSQPSWNHGNSVLSAVSSSDADAPIIYGVTASGEPCKRCQKQGGYCFQHKWQGKDAEVVLGITDGLATKYKLAIAGWWKSCNKIRFFVTASLFFLMTTMGIIFRHPISVRVWKHRSDVVSLCPLACGLAFLTSLSNRYNNISELLKSVENSVRRVRYIGDLPAFHKSSTGRASTAVVAPSNLDRRKAILKSTREKLAYARPASQLMATAKDVDGKDFNGSGKNGSVKVLRRAVLPVLVLATVATKHDYLIGIVRALKSNISPAHFRDKMVPILDGLNASGIKGQVIYTLSLLVWTMTAGITTPVETAAGIAFGAKKGIACNAIGKIGGSILSFVLGRYFLYKYVQGKLGDNELLGLVEESIERNPLGVSLMMRFSPLPEFAKNFGLSVLKVRARWFAIAVMLHGLPFTCLWTSMGAETASIMRGGTPSTSLKLMLTFVSWFGFLSPTIIGLWINSLRKKSMEREEENSV